MSETPSETGHKSHHILFDGLILIISSTLFVWAVDYVFNQFKDSENEGNPLTTAIVQASTGSTEELQPYIAGNLEKKDLHGDTPLMMACYVNFFDHNKTEEQDKVRSPLVSYLLEQGATADEKDKDGWTALFWASWSGMTDTAKVLVNAGSDINLADRLGNTPLMIAAQRGNPEIVRLFLDHQAKVSQANSAGKTALDLAKQEKDRFAATLGSSDRERALTGKLWDNASVAAQHTVRLVQAVELLEASLATK